MARHMVVQHVTRQVTWLYESDVEGDWIVDCVDDCVVWSNHRVTHGPIRGHHDFFQYWLVQKKIRLQRIRTPNLQAR
jgi:hypothetical protein